MRPDPSDAKTSACPCAFNLARRYSRRPAFLSFEKAAGTTKASGSFQPDPAIRDRAGRAKIRAQTSAATGLPGNPKTGTSCHMASASGRPGLTAIRQLLRLPSVRSNRET